MTDSQPRLKALVVDDEKEIRELTGYHIQKLNLNLTVLEAASVMEAKSILRHSTPSLIICDFEMPNGNGLDLLRHVQDSQIHVAFILYTGKALDDLPPIEYTSFFHVQKPCLKKLVEIVSRCLSDPP